MTHPSLSSRESDLFFRELQREFNGRSKVAEQISKWQSRHRGDWLSLGPATASASDVSFTWSHRNAAGAHLSGWSGTAQVDDEGKLHSVAVDLDQKRTETGGLASWVADNPLPFVAILAALIFALLQVPLNAFYSEFGVTLEDVGLTHWTVPRVTLTVLALALGAGVLLAAGLLASLIGVHAAIGITKELTPLVNARNLRELWRRRTGGTLVATVAFVFVVGLFAANGLVGIFWLFVFAFASLIVVVVTVLLERPTSDPFRQVAEQAISAPRHAGGKALFILLPLFSLAVAAFFTLPGDAREAAARVWRGCPANPATSFSPYQATPVVVFQKEGAPAIDPPLSGSAGLRLLGQTSDVYVVFDSEVTKEVYRLAKSDFTVASVFLSKQKVEDLCKEPEKGKRSPSPSS